MKKPKSFEEGMARLEELLDTLSSPDTPLEEAIKLYSETAGLVEWCNAALKNASLEMEEIDARLAGLAAPEAGE
ncbi:exodeoxyribonuclease VII small subunit [Allofournierella sp.]|uniref:exodeoxyribonuclease VII small subunit n=1 Tax=Allofournierella sp. TaxID=1940256 RepID=UPI0015A75D5D|nr:hypothetical protein CE91St44_19430 [Oscillospiraceae bacterium]